MAITNEDLQLMQAERNTDNADGGGMMTGTPLSDSDINQLWDDIDSTELARGGVSLRRFFAAVRTTNTDKLLGARLAVMKDAEADNVSTLLFQSGDHYAVRSDIQEQIESYVVISTKSALRPVGTQRADQRAVILYADYATDAPNIGDILAFDDGTDRQFIQITDIEESRQSYVYQLNQEYKRYYAYQFVCSISQPLEKDFAGSDPTPIASHATTIFTTQSSDTATYYGISPLANAASVGDTTVSVEAVQAQIIPVATSEVALVDQVPGIATQLVQASGESQTISLGSLSGSVSRTLPVAWVPGTLTVTVGTALYTDSGNELQLQSGTDKLSSAAVYPALARLDLTLTSSASVTVEFTPGVAINLPPFTRAVEITSANRQLTYTQTLSPIPALGTLRIEFLYQGEWYTLSDDGSGALSGDGATGTLNHSTGSLSFVLPSEPDENSTLIYTWASDIYESLGTADVGDVGLFLPLTGTPENGSLTISWERNSTAYSLTQNTDGSWTGNGSAEVVDGGIVLVPSALPTGSVTVAGNQTADGSAAIYGNVIAASAAEVTLATQAEIMPTCLFSALMSVEIVNTIDGEQQFSREQFVQQFWGRAAGQVIRTRVNGKDINVGTFDVSTGEITFDPTAVYRPVTQWTRAGSSISSETINKLARLESQTISVTVWPDTTAVTAFSTSLDQSDVTVRVPFGVALMPAAQWLTVGGLELVDQGDDAIYRGWNTSTAAGVQVGAMNYSEGLIELDYSQVSSYISSLAVVMKAGAKRLSSVVPITDVTFRTSGAPLRTSGLTLQARRVADGALISATSDIDGNVSGSFDTGDTITEITVPGTGYTFEITPVTVGNGSASGSVTYQTGVVSLSFSQPVYLSTLTYSAVSYSTISLDPERIGLDPVKLPASGKVPQFKNGNLVLIHHTDTLEESTPTAAQIIDCGRTDLAVIRVKDAAGTALDSAQYTIDLSAGTVTLADPFVAQDSDGNSLTMPLTIYHRVQDLCALSGVRVDGLLSLMTDLTHDYPLGALCSAVVEFGDLQARVEGMFEQKIDVSGEFEDELVGDTSVAQYDALTYPFEVNNLGAVEERWKLRFTSASVFDVIGEQRGVILEDQAIGNDCAPINPFTGTAYFTVLAAGFGSGWITGNAIRFNTKVAAAPVEAIRTTLASSTKLPDQTVEIEFMGDAD
ncbi:hypothetical protein [Oceanobacter mangrovi]|uniref:hypothetical protein n=1 Tax=Oceanobacter mangrovi TaxID=2862510 RepID=UPI001C8EEA39|nr:hypothetical protein [Oceanobacter mangrovi]